MRHLTNFLPALGKIDPNNQYVVLIRQSLPQIESPENIVFKRVPDNKASGLKSRIVGDLIQIPLNLKKDGIGLIVSLMNFGPIISSIPHVLFQANPTYFCNYLLNILMGKKKVEVYFRRLWTVESMKRADLIITPSDAMTEMIKQKCPSVRKRNFKTLYHGINHQASSSAPDEELLKPLSFSGHKLFYPTHLYPHKGFDILFKSLSILKNKKINFRLFTTISYEDWPEGMQKYKQMVDKFDLANNVVFLGNVPQDQIGYFYEQCDLMVFPSLCESFGFPMFEAMAFDLPTVAAGTLINREICNDAALYYDPLDPEDGANKIMLALDKDTSNTLRQKAKLRLNSYDWSWNRCAKNFFGLIEEFVV